MAKKLTALEIEAQDTPEGFVTTPLFDGWNGVIRGSVGDQTSPEIVGKRGRIYLWDDEHIAVWFQRVGWFTEASRVLSEVPGTRIFNRGDAEGALILPNAAMEIAAALIQARKRRRVSEETRAHLKAIGSAHRFPVGTAQEGQKRPGNAIDANGPNPQSRTLFHADSEVP